MLSQAIEGGRKGKNIYCSPFNRELYSGEENKGKKLLFVQYLSVKTAVGKKSSAIREFRIFVVLSNIACYSVVQSEIARALRKLLRRNPKSFRLLLSNQK